MATRSSAVKVVQVSNMKSQRRVMRRPQHSFDLIAKPYEICPFFIAPVVPGESLDSGLFQTRAVSDPVKNRLIGWHKEYYFFYVPHLALASRDIYKSMMLDPTTAVSGIMASANSVPLYTFKGGMPFVSECLTAVVAEFFRDEGETNAPTIENYPAAQITQESWHNSIKLESATGDDNELPGVDPVEEEDILEGFTAHYAQWEIMRDAGYTDATYEDFLKSYGIDAAPEVREPDDDTKKFPYVPELIRYVRDWKYPTNTIDPANGSASSALSWSLAEKITKRRFFKYPGFLFGVTIARPKIYLGNQKGAAVGMLNDAYSWLPAILNGYPYTSVKETLDSVTDGILQNQTEDYWLDVKDLFIYGDQFVNHAMDAAANHGLAMPTAALDHKYLTEAMIDSLFVNAGSEYVREDGVVHMNILGKQSETTP